MTLEEQKNNLEKNEMVQDKTKSKPWVFFDYSGTLVDTVNALSKTYTRFLGKEFTPEQVKSMFKDYPKMGKIKLMWKYRFNPFKWIFSKDELEEIKQEEFRKNARAFPGISEMLQRLQKMADINLGIVTHDQELANEEKRQELLEHFGISTNFDAVITDKENKKIPFDTFIQENNISKAIVIGDTDFDIELGKKHDFPTIGVTWGFSTADEMSADYIIDDIRQTLQIIISLLRQ